MLNQCESKLTCTVLGCDKRHHTFLHNPKYSQYNKESKEATINETIDSSKNQNTLIQNHFRTKLILLKIIPLISSNGNKKLKQIYLLTVVLIG